MPEPQKIIQTNSDDSLQSWAIIFSLLVNAFVLAGVIFLMLARNNKQTETKIALPPINNQNPELNHDLARFKKMQAQHFNHAIGLIKTWIQAGKKTEASALQLLVYKLADTELADIFKMLTPDERILWKQCLESETNDQEQELAYHFIKQQIADVFMQSSVEDNELCDQLIALSINDLSQLCLDHQEAREILPNILSTKILAEILALLPPDKTVEILERSSGLKAENFASHLSQFKEKIFKKNVALPKSPSLEAVIHLLPSADLELERKLYAILIKHDSFENVRETARKILPVDIINHLPESLEKQIKDEKIVEVDSDMIKIARQYISSTPGAQAEIDQQIEQWLNDINNEIAQKETPDLILLHSKAA